MSRWLTRELARVVAGASSRSLQLEELLHQMAASRMPTLVSILADGPRWGADELKQIKDFVTFWQESPDYPSVQPLIVCLAISYPAFEKRKGWLQALNWRRNDPRESFEAFDVPASRRIACAMAPRLGSTSVSRQHVGNWLDLEVRPRRDALRINEAALERRIEQIFSEYEQESGEALMPMGPLAEALERALESCRLDAANGELFE